ncbi:MAG: hypothetical protein ACLP19_18075 [Xanthobacteraceae bacterium]
MSHLSRRSLVASAAALSVLAVPVVAVAVSAEPDPISAAIERWKKALAVENASYGARSAAQEAFQDQYGSLTPSGMPREMGEIFKSEDDKNPYWSLRTHKQITELKSHPDLGKLVPFFHRTLNISTDDYDENVAPLEEASDQAASTRIDAAYAVFDTVPTTLAGMRAKITWAMSVDHVTELFIGTHESLGNFLDTLYASARLIAQA